MRGISVFLNEALSEETITYIEHAKKSGFKGIFTSMHIPEEDTRLYADRLRQLGAIAKSLSLKLMVDVSSDALQKAGFSFEDSDELKKIGVTGLRMDYGIDNRIIAELSHKIDIGLNASTITTTDIQELKAYNGDFSRFEAWHNYYPRPETGLERKWFIEKNHWLKENQFKIFAFVPGNKILRGPLHLSLPTLEDHRGSHPLYCAQDLIDCGVDATYVGDPQIDEMNMKQWWTYDQNATVLLRVVVDQDTAQLILGPHHNRLDVARDVIRSADARFKKVSRIKAKTTQARLLGAITIDNENYGRYMGEIQIVRRHLLPDEKVNVVGYVIPEDISLIPLIQAGTSFTLQEEIK